jgi:hypothetical protein
VLGFTALQRELPRDALGRALSTVDAMLLGGTVLASLLATGLYSAFGLTWSLGIIGLGFPALALLGLPALRAIDRDAAEVRDRLRSRVELLEQLDLFAGASPSTLERLAESAEPQHVSAGTTIITQGDAADALWVLAAGRLEITALADGTVHALPAVSAPGYVGELGLLHTAARSASVATIGECELLRIEAADFLAALEDAPASASMLTVAGERLARTGLVRPALAGRGT